MHAILVPVVATLLLVGTLPARSQERRPDARPAAGPGTITFIQGGRLARIQPDGRRLAPFPLVLGSLGYFQPYSARLAPDGRRLAFGLGEMHGWEMHSPSKIQVLDATRTSGVKVVADLSGTELNDWAWSPDGKKLAFSSWDVTNRTRNWLVDLATKQVKEVRLPRVKTAQGEFQMGVEDWSPDGRWFVATAGGVHLVRTNGSGARRLTPAGLGIYGGTCRFSPDGRKVLFVGHGRGQSEVLYMAEVAGGKPKPIVQFLNFTDMHACWSPDGRRIAYSVTFLDTKGRRGTESNLNVIDADGTNSKTLVSVNHEPYVVALVLIGWR